MGLSAMLRSVRSPALVSAATPTVVRHYAAAVEQILRKDAGR